jgi:hypothetical protein
MHAFPSPSPSHPRGNHHTPATTLPAIVAAGILMSCPGVLAAAPPTMVMLNGTALRPLAGPHYQKMRALGRYLDTTAQGALEGAVDDARHGSSSDSSFLFSIRAFARSSADFHRKLDEYEGAPFDLPSEVEALGVRAREIDEKIRAAQSLASTYDEWEGIMDVLGRMTALVAGQEVEVPAAYVSPVLSGPGLEQLRQLARDLEISATRAHATAQREVGSYDRGRQFLGELGHFEVQSRDLRLRAEAGDVDPQEIGPIVDRLLEEARQADRRMRDAQTFPHVWDDSGRTITILQRMTTLVRS